MRGGAGEAKGGKRRIQCRQEGVRKKSWEYRPDQAPGSMQIVAQKRSAVHNTPRGEKVAKTSGGSLGFGASQWGRSVVGSNKLYHKERGIWCGIRTGVYKKGLRGAKG